MIKAELWDRMQHIMSRFNDHMMHILVQYDTQIDIALYKKALSIAIDKVPILKHKWRFLPIRPKWTPIKGFSVDDIVSITETDGDPVALAEKLLVTKINERREAQVKLFVVRGKAGDVLAYVLNHMVFDGSDLRKFHALVVAVYNDLKRGGNGDIPAKNGSRAEIQVLSDLSPEDRKRAENLYSYNKDAKNPVTFPFAESRRKKLSPRLIKSFTEAESFAAAKQFGKTQGVTLNDIIMGCYIRAISKFIEIPKGGLGVPGMIDLRKYIASGDTAGFTNLTSMVICNIGEDIGGDIFETVAKVHADLDAKKKDLPGLHGLPNMRHAFKVLPYFIVYPLTPVFYKNPLVAMSNIGILDEAQFALDGCRIEDMYMTGSIKYPPYMQIALTTFRNRVTYTCAIYCSDADEIQFRKLFDAYHEEFERYARGNKT